MCDVFQYKDFGRAAPRNKQLNNRFINAQLIKNCTNYLYTIYYDLILTVLIFLDFKI